MNRGRATIGLCAMICASLVAVSGCDFRQASVEDPGEAKSGLRTGREVLRYSFDQENLDPALWSSEPGSNWKVVDGELHGAEVRNKALWFKKPLPSSVRVEFDARKLNWRPPTSSTAKTAWRSASRKTCVTSRRTACNRSGASSSASTHANFGRSTIEEPTSTT